MESTAGAGPDGCVDDVFEVDEVDVRLFRAGVVVGPRVGASVAGHARRPEPESLRPGRCPVQRAP